MRKLTAEFIFHPSGQILSNIGLIFDDQKKLLDILDTTNCDLSTFEYYPGLLVPGFINAHCHLELSHMKSLIPTGTGLISFIESVVGKRNINEDHIMQCIQDADHEMEKNGIIAVGDISNKIDTKITKQKSKLHYHTFVESFDFMQTNLCDNFFATYREVYDSFGALDKSMVPHAPYSVSPKLFELISNTNPEETVISIHNQEVLDENLLFLNKAGNFPSFFGNFGFSFDTFIAPKHSSIYYALQHLNPNNNILFVHNTLTETQEMKDALSWNPNAYFVTCPNANLYIENKLPQYKDWLAFNNSICIGTDSLSSNWSLSILEEIKTIQKYQSYIPLENLLTWATINGARALRLDHKFGSFDIGKYPSVNWIQSVQLRDSIEVKPDAVVSKII